MTTNRALALGFAIALCWLPATTAAQQQLGAIQGTVSDQTRGLVPGVTISVTNLNTGMTRTTVSNDSGIYRVPSLDPGRYKVVAELQGFRTATQTDLTLSVGATLGVNFTLQPGTLEESVQVIATSPDIQTEKADISAVVEQKKIVDLPLVGRNVLSLAALQPGINGIPSTNDFLVPEQGLGVTANGVRETGNNAMVDGASINNGPWGGTMIIVPNVEAVQEFQVIANNPSAEYGRNAGATVSVITKGGTNQFSGSVFEFHRNQDLREKGYFEPTKAPFRRNDFGGSIGGPIKRDNAFFFFSYEGVRELNPNSFQTTVESKQLVDFVNATRPNSNAARLFRDFAPPSYPTTGLRDLGGPLPGANVWSTTPDGIPDVGTINVVQEGERTGDQFNGRFDQVMRSGRDRLRATYYFSRSEGPYLYVRSQFNHPYPFKDQLLNVNHTTMFSNRTLNEITFGYLRQDGHAEDPTPESPTIETVGNGVARFGVEFWHPIEFTQNNIQFKDTLTLDRGRHSFRTGGELRSGHDGATLHHWERPNYTFQSILDFIDDEAFTETRAVDPLTGQSTTAYGKYITNEWALFFQDNWKVRPNLTLNLGLRYDNFGNAKKDRIPFNGEGRHGRQALRHRLEQPRAALRDLVGPDGGRQAGVPRRRRHLLQPCEQHGIQRRAPESATVCAGHDNRAGRDHPHLVHARAELSAQPGSRTGPRRERRNKGSTRRTARCRSGDPEPDVLQLVCRSTTSAPVELRRRSQLHRVGGTERVERGRSDVRGLQPVLRRSARRRAEPAQPELRLRRLQRESRRYELQRREHAASSTVLQGLGVPVCLHLWRPEGHARELDGRHPPRAGLQLRRQRHPSQGRDQLRRGDSVFPVERRDESCSWRVAGERDWNLPIRRTVHGELHPGVAAV
jgi:hypothetical protein